MLDALGNIGDFIGGIGVVVTLAYLGIQIRQNSRTTKTAAAQSVMQSISEYFRSASESEGLARIVQGAFTDFNSLDNDDKARFYLWTFSWFRLMELAHHHYQLGNIPNSFWSGQVAHLSSLIDAPGVQRFWQARKDVFSLEFIEFVDSLEIATDGTTVDKVLEIVKNEPSA